LWLLETIRGKKSSLVVALPYVEPTQSIISVEQKTGEIEDFKFQKIINSLKKVGVTDELAKNIVTKVQAKLCKMDPPISTGLIKAAVVEEVKKENPEAAKKLKKRKLWELKSF
jgi:2-phosphoglycerate kinase